MKELKKLRRAAGMTQYALARATRISRARISHFELGIAIPTVRERSVIKKTLDRVIRRNAAIISDDPTGEAPTDNELIRGSGIDGSRFGP